MVVVTIMGHFFYKHTQRSHILNPSSEKNENAGNEEHQRKSMKIGQDRCGKGQETNTRTPKLKFLLNKLKRKKEDNKTNIETIFFLYKII